MYVCACASVLSVTTGPFIKVLALHLPWSLDCMLAAPGKTYITVCLPLFSPPPPPSLSFISLPQSLLPLLSVQLISKDLMGMACLTSFFS